MINWLRGKEPTEEELEEKIQAEIRKRVFRKEGGKKKQIRRARDEKVNLEALQEMTDLVSDEEIDSIANEVRARYEPGRKREKKKKAARPAEKGAGFLNKLWDKLSGAVFSGRSLTVMVVVFIVVLIWYVGLPPHGREAPVAHLTDTIKSWIGTYDINALDKAGYTPLIVAVRKYGRVEVNQLFKEGADPDGKDARGKTPLMHAVEEERTRNFSLLLYRRGGVDLNARDVRGRTALMLAAEGGRGKALKSLLGVGADVNAKDNLGETALMRAVAKGRGDLVKTLLSFRADVSAVDERGRNALSRAGTGKREEMAKLLAMAKQLESPAYSYSERDLDYTRAHARGGGKLIDDARENSILAASQLLDAGVDIDYLERFSDDHHTALMTAVYYKKYYMVRFLLARGADVNASKKGSVSAFSLAAMRREHVIMKLLVGAGAEVNARVRDGSTALILTAANAATADTVKLLIELGADKTMKDRGGNSALMRAAENGRTPTVELLLEHGLDINARNKQGQTALFLILGRDKLDNWSMRRGWHQLFMAGFLLDNGADIDAKDNQDQTVLMIAAERERAGFVKYLLDNGADATARDKQEKTAYTRALARKNCGIAELLRKPTFCKRYLFFWWSCPELDPIPDCS